MAAEASSTTNGVYDAQVNQPAELAASTPSQTSATQQNKADPQEIGWYFVEQYYTTLSKTPERIHLFYSKKSQLVTGVEAEKVVPCVGTKAISEKIKALDIQDCKVRVLNVDSQASFDNIVVQVIGALSNKSQPHHKFVQTFVLATQPNGYFVLNDIFRYLNEEEDEIIEDQPAEQAAPTAEPVAEAEEQVVDDAPIDTVDTEAAAATVDAKLEEDDKPAALAEEENVNGVEPTVEAEAAAEEPEDTTTAEDEAPVVAEEPVTAPAVEQPAEPQSTPEPEASKSSADQTQTAPVRKTWASLVGTSKPAIPALPATATISSQPKAQRTAQAAPAAPKATPQAATQAPSASSPTPVTAPAPAPAPATQGDEWQMADHGKKAKGPQTKAGSEGIVHAYIKNVSDKIDARELKRTLESFGELKYYDVWRPRNCAFVEFADPAGYAAAVAANPHDVNGEPIVVEERRPRPNAYGGGNPNFNRGGSNAGRGRGGLQGQGRPNGQGGSFQKDNRGGLQQRGGRSGNVTPKGRGQAPTA